jgi:hypothetical protein
MSDASTTRLIRLYMEEAEAPMFLSGFFQSPPENFHNTEKVEIDVLRDDEDIAIVVTDLTTGARDNENTQYVNKGFTPPLFDEKGTISAYDTIKRQPGQDPFQNPDFAFNATNQAFRLFRRLEKKIRRSVELMASQVFQTGVLTLKDSAGTALYTLDFQPKSTHVVTVNTTWATNGSAGNPLGDLSALATVVRRDGKKQPTKLVFGPSALQRFLANADVKAQLDNRAMQIGSIAPQTRGQGATFQGFVWIGHYRFEIWMYDGFYRDPQTGNHTDYIGTNNVIMMSDGARLDLSWGAIPMIVAPESRALPFLPARMSDSGRGLDFTPNAYVSPNGKQLILECGTRPLTIPTAIDTFACLTVVTG